jgi:proline dehydrogenase
MPANKRKGLGLLLPLILGLIVLTLVFYRYGEMWLRHLLIYLSHATWARDMVSSLPLAKKVASRFVAGETIDEAMQTARQLNSQGISITLDYLGESVTQAHEAIASRNEIIRLLDRIAQTGVEANVSVKLSQLGLKIDKELALDNMRRILERARHHGNKVRIDMEESSLVDTTLDVYRTLRFADGFENVGAVIQAYLHRSEEDVRQLINEGAWIRLCKGAYAEPPHVAFPVKADTDANYMKLTKMMLSQEARDKGVHLAVATHDQKIVQATIDFAQEQGIPAQAYEFQMLYGIRRELQDWLVQRGYRVRTYVPYGTAWYPYFVRRLAERPANLWFFVSNFMRR